MDNRNVNGEEVGKAIASAAQTKEGQVFGTYDLSSEPLKKYIVEFRNELHIEMAGISKIKW